MKEDENILDKAVEAIKKEQISDKPPREVTEATIAKLREASDKPQIETLSGRIQLTERLRVTKNLTKIAAAAVLLIAAGYTTGRIASPRPPGMEQIRAAVEPAIREDLLNEMRQYLQLGLASCYVRLQDDLHQQYRRDLSQVAAHTLAASGAVTNRLLEELIESINAAQTQNTEWVASALEQIDLNRRRDSTQLSNALASFAVQTEDKLQRTRQDVEQLLYYTQPDSAVPDEPKNSNNLN